ncbi:hypothetical protein PR048_017365 [Dryococelus australis]|uniref:PiggyBac transposable element-derived protein domain-containing protein n=1 Tax=Dryococelus australis TaxID=614101 RepID=A0ABQ9H9B3_9NEOP|nr:hypothetical protein PR048_017365 [Dryococelus australis]
MPAPCFYAFRRGEGGSATIAAMGAFLECEKGGRVLPELEDSESDDDILSGDNLSDDPDYGEAVSSQCSDKLEEDEPNFMTKNVAGQWWDVDCQKNVDFIISYSVPQELEEMLIEASPREVFETFIDCEIERDPTGAVPMNVVLQLSGKLLDKGRTVVTDNYYSRIEEIVVLKWKDKCDVLMISTTHSAELVEINHKKWTKSEETENDSGLQPW